MKKTSSIRNSKASINFISEMEKISTINKDLITEEKNEDDSEPVISVKTVKKKINFIKDEKILKKLLLLFNIRELFILRRINSKFYNLIMNMDIFQKYLRIRKEFQITKKEVDNIENIKQKNIIISEAVKQIKRENSPQKKIFHSIVLTDKTYNKKISPLQSQRKLSKIYDKIDSFKLSIFNIAGNNGELINKINKKYGIMNNEEDYIYNGLFEYILLDKKVDKSFTISNYQICTAINYLYKPFSNLNLINIQKLDFSNNNLNTNCIKSLGNILELNNNSLKFLNLSHNNFDDNSCKVLFNSFINLKCLFSLNLSYNKIGSTGILNAYVFFLKNTSLNTFIISHNLLGDKGITLLVDYLLKNQKLYLRTLDISFNGIQDNGVRFFCEYLKSNTKLISLFIGGNYIRDEGIAILTETLFENNLNKISYLFLENNALTSKGADSLSKIISYFPFINSISLKTNKIKDDGVFKLFKNLQSESKIISINLSNNHLTYVAIKNMIQFLDEKIALRELILDNNPLKKESCKYLKDLITKKTNLRLLSLVNCGIKDEINLIFEGLKENKILETLNMSKNNLGVKRDLLALCIKHCKENKSLKELILDDNKFIDDDFKTLSEIDIDNRQIKYLSFKNNNLTTKSLYSILNLIEKLKVLRKFDVEGNFLNPNDKLKIEELLLQNKLNKNIVFEPFHKCERKSQPIDEPQLVLNTDPNSNKSEKNVHRKTKKKTTRRDTIKKKTKRIKTIRNSEIVIKKDLTGLDEDEDDY